MLARCFFAAVLERCLLFDALQLRATAIFAAVAFAAMSDAYQSLDASRVAARCVAFALAELCEGSQSPARPKGAKHGLSGREKPPAADPRPKAPKCGRAI